jgi:hypothetical protein
MDDLRSKNKTRPHTCHGYASLNPALPSTGITVPPALAWHTFGLWADLASQRFVKPIADGKESSLGSIRPAKRLHADWADHERPVMKITTEFRNLEFGRIRRIPWLLRQ